MVAAQCVDPEIDAAIGTVISADIPHLGRLRPGDTLSFAEVSVAEAEEARREQEKEIKRLISSLSPAAAWLDEVALYRENLISGVVHNGEVA